MPAPTRRFAFVLLAASLVASMGGCPSLDGDDLEDLLEEAAEAVNDVIDNFQESRPFLLPAGVVLPDGVVLEPDPDVIVIDNFIEDVPAAILPNSNFVALTNDTGVDILVEFTVVVGNVAIEDAAFVFDLESVLLGYDCADLIAIDAEYHFDPLTGELLDEFFYDDELVSILFQDHECGDLIEYIFTPDFVDTAVSVVDLY